jgi:predicted nucleotidyltransferase
MKRAAVLKLVQSHQDQLKKLGVKSLNLFGSVARDQANSQSVAELALFVSILRDYFHPYSDNVLIPKRKMVHE